MGDKKVKGSILLDYVRMIRANKDKDWGTYLTEQDWEIINGRILPSVWYPFETFKRSGLATFHVLGSGKLDLVRAWGRISMEQLVKGIYKSIVADMDPGKALDKFVLMRRQFFNFSALETEPAGDKHIKLRFAYDPNDEGYEPYCTQLKGGFERLIELTGGKNPNITFAAIQWNDEPATEFDITWD